MKYLLKKHASKLRFGIIGGINTAIDFVLLFLLHGFGLNPYVANIISTSIAFVFSFFANRTFTFRSRGSIKKQLLPFLIVTIIGLWVIQPIIIWIILLPLGGIDENIALFVAKIIATVASLLWNYLMYSRFVFKERT